MTNPSVSELERLIKLYEDHDNTSVSELERLIKLYEDHDNTFEEMLSRKLDNDRWLEWFDEQAKRKLNVGKEFCNVTKDRNSMNVANIISIQMAKKLVDDIKSGRYY